MITKKQSAYLFFFMIISGIISFCLLQFYTIPNETINWVKINQSEYINLYYLNNHPKFNYLHGLWLMFSGIMMFCLIALIELPDRFNELKQDFIKKYRK